MDYWKEKVSNILRNKLFGLQCLDLQLNLSMQKVDEADQGAKNSSSAQEYKSITDQVAKLQKDVEAASKQTKSLQLQI